MVKVSGGSKGALPPIQILSICAVFGKIWQNHMLAPPPGWLAPPPLGNPGSATESLFESRIMNSHIFFTADFSSSGCPHKNIHRDESLLVHSSMLNCRTLDFVTRIPDHGSGHVTNSLTTTWMLLTQDSIPVGCLPPAWKP